MHLLPVHWVAAANTALLTLFTTLALAAWVSARDARGIGRVALLTSVPVLLALALLCKESAALTPGLMLVVAAFVGLRRPFKGDKLGPPGPDVAGSVVYGGAAGMPSPTIVRVDVP